MPGHILHDSRRQQSRREQNLPLSTASGTSSKHTPFVTSRMTSLSAISADASGSAAAAAADSHTHSTPTPRAKLAHEAAAVVLP